MKKTQCGRYTILKQNRNNLIKLLYHLHKIDRMVILFFFFAFFHFVVYNDSITVKMYITYISAYTTIYSSYTRQRRHHEETYRAGCRGRPAAPAPALRCETRGSYLQGCQEARAAGNQFASGVFEAYIPV